MDLFAFSAQRLVIENLLKSKKPRRKRAKSHSKRAFSFKNILNKERSHS